MNKDKSQSRSPSPANNKIARRSRSRSPPKKLSSNSCSNSPSKSRSRSKSPPSKSIPKQSRSRSRSPSPKPSKNKRTGYTAQQLKRAEGYSKLLKPFGSTTRYLRIEEIEKALHMLVARDGLCHTIGVLPFITFMDILQDNRQNEEWIMLMALDSELFERLILIVNVENHWLAILFDKANRKILIVDSLAGTKSKKHEEQCLEDLAADLKEGINATVNSVMRALNLEEYTVRTRCLGIQTNSYDCGVWALEFAAKFVVDGHTDGITKQHFLAKGSTFIKEARKRWSNVLYPNS